MTAMNQISHVALVGCGYTGTSAFYQLVSNYSVTKITIFEASGEFGPGYPYHTDECADYLINNTTDTMGIEPTNRRAFYEWLKGQAKYRDADPKGHLPRSVFGEYLKHIFDYSMTTAKAMGIDIELVPFEVTDIEYLDKQTVRLSWSEGQTLADAAILTLGRSPSVDAYPHPPESSSARYIADHVMNTEIVEVELGATIHILGASLSAYDVINQLFSESSGAKFIRNEGGELTYVPGENQRRVILMSRSGRLKHMQSMKPIAVSRSALTLSSLKQLNANRQFSLAQIMEALRQEAKKHNAVIDWEQLRTPFEHCSTQSELDEVSVKILEQAIHQARHGNNFLVDLFQDAENEIWDAFAENLLDLQSELHYRQNYETAVLTFGAPCPVPTAEKLLALMRSGHVSIRKGVTSVSFNGDTDNYEIAHDYGVESASILVNTTGSVDRDVDSDSQPPLLKSLVEQSLLKPYSRDGVKLQGANINMSDFSLPEAPNIYLANMLLWGPGFFTSSAYLMCRIVDRILQSIFGEDT